MAQVHCNNIVTASFQLIYIAPFQTILYRREPSDLMTYYVLVHVKANLKLLETTTPFKGTNHEWEKEEWLKDNKDRIAAYQARMKHLLVIAILSQSCHNVLTMHFLPAQESRQDPGGSRPRQGSTRLE